MGVVKRIVISMRTTNVKYWADTSRNVLKVEKACNQQLHLKTPLCVAHGNTARFLLEKLLQLKMKLSVTCISTVITNVCIVKDELF